MKSKCLYLLLLIFLITFASRLYMAFQTEGFSDDSAYYIIRQVENVKEKWIPIYHDELSYSGRVYSTAPLYFYVLALFDVFLPYTFKIIPNLFASLLVFIVFLIAREISKNDVVSLFTAFISGFIPVFFSTINNISPYTLATPLIFFMLFCLLKIGSDKRYVSYFIISSFILSLAHASAFLIILSSLVYLIFIKIESFPASKAEFELILFSTFLIIWVEFLFYKNAFLIHGPLLIWQNIPKSFLSLYFAEFNLLKAVSLIGIIPFIFGIYILYLSIFKEKNKEIYLLISFILPILLLLWLKLIKLNTGLIFLGILLSLMFAYFLKRFMVFLEKTKVASYKNYILILFIIVFIITSVIPSFIQASEEVKIAFSYKELNALKWMKENTKEDAVILATVGEGNLINQVSKRKNVFDTNFLLINGIDQRVKDVNLIFRTVLQTEAISLLNKYNINYIYFSDRARKGYGIKELVYVDDTCFDLVYDDVVQIYYLKCRLEEQ